MSTQTQDRGSLISGGLCDENVLKCNHLIDF